MLSTAFWRYQKKTSKHLLRTTHTSAIDTSIRQYSPTWRYRILIRALSPLVALYTLWRARRDGGKAYLCERLGLYPQRRLSEPASNGVIWIHAASVGEVFTVLPLIKAVNAKLLVTTTTPTGAQVLAQQGLAHVTHCYLPVDLPGACKRFFQHHTIREGWIVETEIWPWLYACANKNAVGLSIISGRLSSKTSSQANGFLAATFRRALQDVTVLARSDEDALRFATLGASPSLVSVSGNLKYANPGAVLGNNEADPLIDRPYVLAASTHDDEEQQMAVAWCQQSADAEQDIDAELDALLVVVPRHAERGAAIQKHLATKGINAALRSKNEAVTDDCRVYIADTLGELQAWYTHALACFVGGSLIERGGHNILEPARLGCPVAVGPHTSNFEDIVVTFAKHDALVVVKNSEHAVRFLRGAIDDPQALQPMTQRARLHAQKSEEVLTVYLEALTGEVQST